MKSPYNSEIVHFRLKFVLKIQYKDKTIAQAARDANVDWKTMKKWVVRFENEGIIGLLNKPRGKFKPVPEEVKNNIIELKKESKNLQNKSSIRQRNAFPHYHFFLLMDCIFTSTLC